MVHFERKLISKVKKTEVLKETKKCFIADFKEAEVPFLTKLSRH